MLRAYHRTLSGVSSGRKIKSNQRVLGRAVKLLTHHRPLLFVLCSLLFIPGCGCRPDVSIRPTISTGNRQRQNDVLLSSAVEQLHNMPNYVDLQLNPPRVILDSSKSSDGQEVMAICTPSPEVPDGPINTIQVPKGNSRFRALRVKPGDVVKYFILVDQESAESGILQKEPIEIPVAQVVNDNALILAGSLNFSVIDPPEKIQIWRYTDERTNEISRALGKYVLRGLPQFAWEPSPDARVKMQIVDRLNQWLVRSGTKDEKWVVDPLLESLPKELLSADSLSKLLSEKSLGATRFKPGDECLLQQAVWLRDISLWAKGNSPEPVEKARSLFDWTVRNIQLENDTSGHHYLPWQTLLYGTGTASERAAVFVLLCRQQNLDAVIVQAESKRLAGLYHDGQLYLFDFELGLPIPGPNGATVATLEQAATDDSLLRQLDLDDAKYPLTSKQLEQVTIELLATPMELSRRAGIIDSKLRGDQTLGLSFSPSELAQRMKDVSHVKNIQLWEQPFQAIVGQTKRSESTRRREALRFNAFAWRPRLWKARLLHFQGAKTNGNPGDVLSDEVTSFQQAVGLYSHRRVRPTETRIDRISSKQKKITYREAKRNAAYWLGLLSYDTGRYAVSESWLRKRVLEVEPDGPWTSGARYNLARALQAQGKIKEAVKLLQGDKSPQSHGNQVLARRITKN